MKNEPLQVGDFSNFKSQNVGFFKDYDDKKEDVQKEEFSKAMKKLIVESQNPTNYGHVLHENICKDWNERTSFQQNTPAQNGYTEAGSVESN